MKKLLKIKRKYINKKQIIIISSYYHTDSGNNHNDGENRNNDRTKHDVDFKLPVLCGIFLLSALKFLLLLQISTAEV